MRIKIIRVDGVVELLLLPNKGKETYSFINLTKGHICPCEFSSVEDAINDIKKHNDAKGHKIIDIFKYTK